jgi:hypothetical protein
MFNNKIDGMNMPQPNVNFWMYTQSVQCTKCQGAVFQNGVMFRSSRDEWEHRKHHWCQLIFHIV